VEHKTVIVIGKKYYEDYEIKREKLEIVFKKLKNFKTTEEVNLPSKLYKNG